MCCYIFTLASPRLPSLCAVTGTHKMLVRPTGVYLVHRLEHWRQTRGRELAAAGEPVLDLDASTPYQPPDLGLGGEPTSANSAGAAATVSDAKVDQSSRAPAREGTRFLGSAEPLRRPSPSWRSGSVRLDPFSPSVPPPPPYTLLTGPPGIGKSALLQYAVAYARANGCPGFRAR